MRARTQAVCPICAKDVQPRAENRAYPFCSPPCKLVDLGRWLDGAYRIPGGSVVDESSGVEGLEPSSDADREEERPFAPPEESE